MNRMKLKTDFTIQEVSDRLGLPKSTLRFWERTFGEDLIPERTAGGQRRYTQQHLIHYEKIRKMRSAGLSLREIKSRLEMSTEDEMDFQTNVRLMEIADHIGNLVSTEIYQLLLNKLSNDSRKSF